MQVARAFEEAAGAMVRDVSTAPQARAAGLSDYPGLDMLAVYLAESGGVIVTPRDILAVGETGWASTSEASPLPEFLRPLFWDHRIEDLRWPTHRDRDFDPIHGECVTMHVEHLMTRDDLIERLAASRSQWVSFGVSAIFVFGSAARNEAREQSDVDLLVDFDRPVGLFEFLHLRRVLSDLVGRPVDLVTRAALKPQLRDRILAEAIRAA